MSELAPVERGKIREFAIATKSAHPAYHSEEAVAPPTFLSSIRNFWGPSMEEICDELGVDRTRVLHGEERFAFHGPPPRAGDRLMMSSRVVDRYTRTGQRGGTMRFFVTVVEYRDPDDRLVAEQFTTLIETAAPSATTAEGER